MLGEDYQVQFHIDNKNQVTIPLPFRWRTKLLLLHSYQIFRLIFIFSGSHKFHFILKSKCREVILHSRLADRCLVRVVSAAEQQNEDKKRVNSLLLSLNPYLFSICLLSLILWRQWLSIKFFLAGWALRWGQFLLTAALCSRWYEKFDRRLNVDCDGLSLCSKFIYYNLMQWFIVNVLRHADEIWSFDISTCLPLSSFRQLWTGFLLTALSLRPSTASSWSSLRSSKSNATDAANTSPCRST